MKGWKESLWKKIRTTDQLLKVSKQEVQINHMPDPGGGMFLHTTVGSVTSPIPGIRALLRATYSMCKQQLMIMKHSFGHNMLFYQSMGLLLLKCHHPPLSFSLKKETASNSLSHQHNWIWAGRHNGGQKEHRNIFWSSFQHIMLQHTAQLSNTAPFICTKQETQTLKPSNTTKWGVGVVITVGFYTKPKVCVRGFPWTAEEESLSQTSIQKVRLRGKRSVRRHPWTGAAATVSWGSQRTQGTRRSLLPGTARFPRPTQILQVRVMHLPPLLSLNPLYSAELFWTRLLF